jgi:hypothetical protein
VGRFLDPTEPVCARGAIAAVSNDASLYRILNDVSFREHGVNSSEFNDLPTTKEKDVLHLFASAGVEFGRRAASAADEGRYG